MLAAAHAALITYRSQFNSQRYWTQKLDLHRFSERYHRAQLIHLTHGFVEYHSDDAAMGMPRWPLVALRQPKRADRTTLVGVDDEFQPHSLRIVFAAAKTKIRTGLGFRLTRNGSTDM